MDAELQVNERQAQRLTTASAPGWGLDLDELAEVPYRPRALIIDDEPDTIFLLKEVLRKAGFDVTGAYTCTEAVQKCTAINPDVILLDLMMPDVDGWETFGHLRQITDAPVMILSALTNKETIVRGLQSGAEDYLTKPFFNGEVVARTQKMLQRCSGRQADRRLYFPEINLQINLEEQTASYHGHLVTFPTKEFAVLTTLARTAPNMVTHRQIALQVWGEDTPDTRKRIKYLIFLLRRKLEENPEDPRLILNVDRVGYQLSTVLKAEK